MSDAVVIALFSTLGPILTVIVTSIINRKANSRENQAIVQKVETYHKEVNGHMEKMLSTTKALGHAEGKAEGNLGIEGLKQAHVEINAATVEIKTPNIT